MKARNLSLGDGNYARDLSGLSSDGETFRAFNDTESLLGARGGAQGHSTVPGKHKVPSSKKRKKSLL